MDNSDIEQRLKAIEETQALLKIQMIPVLRERDRDQIYEKVGKWLIDLSESVSGLACRVKELSANVAEVKGLTEVVEELKLKLAQAPVPVHVPVAPVRAAVNQLDLANILLSVKNASKPILELTYYQLEEENKQLRAYFALAVVESNGWNMSNVFVACRHRKLNSDIWQTEFDVPYSGNTKTESKFFFYLPLEETHEIEFYLKDHTSSQSLCTRRYRIAESKLHEINIAAGILPDRREISDDQGDRRESTEDVSLSGPEIADQVW